MVRLENADQDVGVYKHALNAIRIDAIAANAFIAQERRRAIMAFSPFVKLAGPLFRIGFLQVSNGS